MTDSVAVRINLAEFKRELGMLAARFERRAVRNGLAAAARVFRDAAKKEAPVLKKAKRGRVPFALRRAIRVVTSKEARKRKGTVGVFVGFGARSAARKTSRDAFYGRFLEASWYPRGPGRRLRGGVNRRNLERRRNAAAGARKITEYAFLEPAFRSKRAQALQAFEARVEREIAAERRKQALR